MDDPVYDAMMTGIHAIADPEEANHALHEAEDYLVEENVYLIPLFNFDTPVLVQAGIDGATNTGIYPYFGYTYITK